MNVAEELKQVILGLGIEDSVVNTINPLWPLAGHVLDSLAYTDFVVAAEEHFGVRILDRYRLRLISLTDFTEYITDELSKKAVA